MVITPAQRVKKVFFGTLADGQESTKDKQTQAVGVQRYGRLAFVMEVKIPRKGMMILPNFEVLFVFP